MIYKEFGTLGKPVVVLLHGGGLSYWSVSTIISALSADYHVITPIIDGHGEDSDHTFESIERAAEHLSEYIEKQHGGKIYALAGLSLGAQIVVELLTRRKNIAQFALIESALVIPIRGMAILAAPLYSLLFRLIKKRWFAKLQAKELFVSDNNFEKYYADSQRITRQTLINITKSNAAYSIKEGLKKTEVKTLIIAGDKELTRIKKSAEILHQTIPDSTLYIVPNMKHGELSLKHQKQYLKLLTGLWEDHSRNL